MRTKLKQKTYHKLRLEDKVEKKNQSFTKGPKIKIINQEKKHQNKNPHKSYDNYEIIHGQHIFQGDGKEKKGKKRKTKVLTTTNNAIIDHMHRSKRKRKQQNFQYHVVGVFGYREAPQALLERRKRLSLGSTSQPCFVLFFQYLYNYQIASLLT
jgi:hypothetical protein